MSRNKRHTQILAHTSATSEADDKRLWHRRSDLQAVKALPEHRLAVELKDGRRGVFDLKPYLHHGSFRELQDAAYFAQVGIQFGAVTWPHGQDIAPETLLAELQPLQSGDKEPSTQN